MTFAINAVIADLNVNLNKALKDNKAAGVRTQEYS